MPTARDILNHTIRVDEVAYAGRWTPARKASLLWLIDNGALTANQAIERHDLSAEELSVWRAGYDVAGARGVAIGAIAERRPA